MLQYDNATATSVMLNGMRSFTLNGPVPTWPRCLACALSDRAFNYTAANRSSECQACFDTWCWDGVDNTTTPAAYAPVLGMAPAFLTMNNLTNGTHAADVATTSKAAAGSVRLGSGAGWWSMMGGLVGVGVGVAAVWA